jgi:hypothetical protein
LPLHTFLLGGSESLTDAIGRSLATMKTLRQLDVSNLPNAKGALLEQLPGTLTSLAIDRNPHWPTTVLASLPELPDLREFGLAGLPQLDDETLGALLANKNLRVLRLGGEEPRGKGRPAGAKPALTGAAGAAVATQRELIELDLRLATWMDRQAMAAIAALPRLETLDLTGPLVNPRLTANDLLPELRANRSIRSLNLRWRSMDVERLEALKHLPLRELQVAGTNLTAEQVLAVVPAWPGCVVTMLQGQRFRVN